MPPQPGRNPRAEAANWAHDVYATHGLADFKGQAVADTLRVPLVDQALRDMPGSAGMGAMALQGWRVDIEQGEKGDTAYLVPMSPEEIKASRKYPDYNPEPGMLRFIAQGVRSALSRATHGHKAAAKPVARPDWY